MDLARDTPVRLVPYPFARLNGALLLEVSEKEALVCLLTDTVDRQVIDA